MIKTFGCQMNVYDSDRMERQLAIEGCKKVEEGAEAKLIILNTCTIREKARHKVLSMLGSLKGLKEKNPDLIMVVAGCVAQQEGKGLLRMVPYLDVVMGPDQVDHLPALIRKAQEKERISITDLSDEEQLSLKPLLPIQGRQNLASAFITVATGCNKKCSYCIVPYVRGVEKCRTAEEIIDECESYLAVGAKELILVGQTVNAYKNNKTSFSELLKRVNDLQGLERLRYLTSHPADMTEDVMECHGTLDKLCESLHLPVQSGSDTVLKRMIRRYKRERFIEIVKELKERVPGITITTDVIVGFPGETEEEFEETMTLLDEVKFDGTYTYTYSPRPDLPSTRIQGEVSEEVKKERLQRYLSLQNEIILKSDKELINTNVEVLVEGTSKSDSRVVKGRTRANKLVHFAGDSSLIGELVDVKITYVSPSHHRGEQAPKLFNIISQTA